MHLGVRDHKCTLCPKGFFNKHELNAHLRTHTKEKPFGCKDCSKAFSRPHHLNRHMVSVHGSRCSRCKANAKCKCSNVPPELPEAQIVIIEDQSILAKEVIDPITFTTKDQTLVHVHPD